jgi:hypothetical protein
MLQHAAATRSCGDCTAGRTKHPRTLALPAPSEAATATRSRNFDASSSIFCIFWQPLQHAAATLTPALVFFLFLAATATRSRNSDASSSISEYVVKILELA